MGYGPWGHKELDTTKSTEHARTPINKSPELRLSSVFGQIINCSHLWLSSLSQPEVTIFPATSIHPTVL